MQFGDVDAMTMTTMATELDAGNVTMEKLGRAMAITLKYQAEMVRHGVVTPAECTAQHDRVRHDRQVDISKAVAEASAGLTAGAIIGKVGGLAVVMVGVCFIVWVVAKGIGVI